MDYVRSPLNYTGNKFLLLKKIMPLFPKKIDTFVDVFGGSGVVTINIAANKKIYNEINENVFNIISEFKNRQAEDIVSHILNRVDEFKLEKGIYKSKAKCQEDIDFYEECDRKYKVFREEINSHEKFIPLDLLTIHYFSFNNLIRVSLKNKFNTPFGNKHFNLDRHKPLIENACSVFKDVELHNSDFRDLDMSNLKEGDFVYLDPPYLMSTAEYNKRWNEELEKDLYQLCDALDKRNIKWAMSNMICNKGEEHTLLKEWCEKNKYNINSINTNYSGWVSVRRDNYVGTIEVLITNY